MKLPVIVSTVNRPTVALKYEQGVFPDVSSGAMEHRLFKRHFPFTEGQLHTIVIPLSDETLFVN